MHQETGLPACLFCQFVLAARGLPPSLKPSSSSLQAFGAICSRLCTESDMDGPSSAAPSSPHALATVDNISWHAIASSFGRGLAGLSPIRTTARRLQRPIATPRELGAAHAWEPSSPGWPLCRYRETHSRRRSKTGGPTERPSWPWLAQCALAAELIHRATEPAFQRSGRIRHDRTDHRSGRTRYLQERRNRPAAAAGDRQQELLAAGVDFLDLLLFPSSILDIEAQFARTNRLTSDQLTSCDS